MRIRTANGVGLVRLWMVPVIVLVLVMSGSAAFGQQSGQVKNKKVGAATSKIIKEEPPMRIMTDNSEPSGSNPGGGSGGGVQGGLGHLDVPAPPYFSSPIYINLPSPPNSPSGIGVPPSDPPLLIDQYGFCICKWTQVANSVSFPPCPNQATETTNFTLNYTRQNLRTRYLYV